MAIEAFASALEIIPRTLAENAGLDPVTTLIELRKAHADGQTHAGINVYEGGVVDMKEANVVEPVRVVEQAIQSASTMSSHPKACRWTRAWVTWATSTCEAKILLQNRVKNEPQEACLACGFTITFKGHSRLA